MTALRPDHRPIAQKNAPEALVDRPRAELLANAAMVVADLDHTLVASKHVHRALVGGYVASIAPNVLASEIDRRYDSLRGQSYSNILSSMLELCNCGNPAPMDFTQFFQGFNAFVARQASTVAPATEIPGARALVEQIKAIQVPFVVCTGSPRSLADLFLRQTGLDQLVSAQQMFCWGDSHLSKADPEFWVPILKELPRGQIVALDDHPHSIEYVMGAGQIGSVMALPSVPAEKFAPLQARFPGRIKLVEGSWDNWP